MKSLLNAVAPPTWTSATPSSAPGSARRRSTRASACGLSGSCLGATVISAPRPSRDGCGRLACATSGSCWSSDAYELSARAVLGIARVPAAQLGDHLGGARGARTALLGGQLGAHERLVALRELAQRTVSEVERQSGDGEREQDGGGCQRRHPWPARDRAGPALPEADLPPCLGRRAGPPA